MGGEEGGSGVGVACLQSYDTEREKKKDRKEINYQVEYKPHQSGNRVCVYARMYVTMYMCSTRTYVIT